MEQLADEYFLSKDQGRQHGGEIISLTNIKKVIK